ncbi:MAG: DNA replication and repair protein RecF [Proteobacteria bacterium]|nr:MAG: DNA replication and repair protein RecF [Pseudomonadota bacterium]
MWLKQLTLENCRIIKHCALELSARTNVFIGGNGSGKSSLVEGLCILSRGRSFRTPRIAEVIRRGADQLIVRGRIVNQQTGREYPLGISKGSQHTHIRINHADIHQQAELSRHLPLTIIHPETVDLLAGSPVQRRALLDWIAFYREPEFHQDWKTYQRILKQRNVCLRESKQAYALAYWTEQFVPLQQRIYGYRERALHALQAALQTLNVLLNPIGEVQLQLTRGFPASIALSDKDQLLHFLRSKEEQEKRYGVTLYGVHRSDILVLLNDTAAAKTASRGQLKLLGIALLLAQSMAILQEGENRGIIVIDDLASEVDNDNQQLLYQVLQGTQQQLIITETRPPSPDYLPTDSLQFHVKQGECLLSD